MSAFWADLERVLLESGVMAESFAAEFFDAQERIANQQIGLVPCPGPHGYETTLTKVWKAYPNPCIHCRAVV